MLLQFYSCYRLTQHDFVLIRIRHGDDRDTRTPAVECEDMECRVSRAVLHHPSYCMMVLTWESGPKCVAMHAVAHNSKKNGEHMVRIRTHCLAKKFRDRVGFKRNIIIAVAANLSMTNFGRSRLTCASTPRQHCSYYVVRHR